MWCRIFFRVRVFILLVVSIDLEAQHKWDGEANDGKWLNPLNWVNDSVPAMSDDVVLDNQYVDSSYSVYFPSGSGQVNLHSIEIHPSGEKYIKVVIPSDNNAVPALALSRDPYSLVLERNAIFINASGATAGSTIDLADSMVIRNGARYVHNTPRSHATLVSWLSRAVGTEEGIFEFDVPDASVTISLSDRVFGKLILNSAAANGSINYTAAGTRPLKVRSDLVICRGVKLNLNFTDTFHILRNYLQSSSIVNLATTTRSLIFMVKGDVIMDTGAIILRSGTGQPSILFAGNVKQNVNIRGQVNNGVNITLYNQEGIALLNPWNISTSFFLKEGKMFSDPLNFISVDSSGSILADSLNIDTYIDGPVSITRPGFQVHTLLPVGGEGEIHWIALKNWKGNCTVSYVTTDPHQVSRQVKGVDHISTHGYWRVSMKTQDVDAGLQVSFNDANASGVTQMSTLTIARLKDSIWIDVGSNGYTGSAGGNGSVIGKELLFSQPHEYFTLASLVQSQNPLPIDTSRERSRMQRNRVSRGTTIERVIKNGNGYRVILRSDKKQKIQLMILNSLNQLIHSGSFNLEPGNNVVYCFPRQFQFGLIHFFGLFSNYRTNTVSIW